MQTIESLKRKIESTKDLQSVIKTMKALAAVNIRQYERAVASLSDYSRTVEMGLHIVLRGRPDRMIGARKAPLVKVGAIVFGSDQGMCGPLNDWITSHALHTLTDQFGVPPDNRVVAAVGHRVSGRMEDQGQPVEDSFTVPGSVAGISPAVGELAVTINRWNRELGLDHVFLFYCRLDSGATYKPTSLHLLPVDREWLMRMRDNPWPTKQVPTYTMQWDPIFSALIQQYLFISLFRAFAESLASENASRLASMQRAEKNVEELLGELTGQYHQQRQMAITEELLDIVSGFEALRKDP